MKSSRFSLVRSLALASLLTSAQSHKLNAPLAHEIRGEFSWPQTSADGTRHLYVADREGNGVYELFSVLANGMEAPRRLRSPFDSGDSGFIAPDGKNVLQLTDLDEDGEREVVVVPIDGSAPERILSAALPPGVTLQGIAAVSATHVLYLAGLQSSDNRDIFSVPIDGGRPAVRLNGDLVASLPVLSSPSLSRDGSTTLYAANQDPDPGFELYVVPTDGSQPARRLPIPLVPGGRVVRYTFDADASHVIYSADQEEDERYELFVIASDGTQAPRKLNGPLAPDGDVGFYLVEFHRGAFWLSPDRRWILYIAGQETDEHEWLYSVPTDGSLPPVRLIASSEVDPWNFFVSPDSAWVVFLSNPFHFPDPSGVDVEVGSVPIDGSAPPRGLSGPMISNGDVRRAVISHDSRTVVYAADQEVDERFELYSVPIEGGAAPVKLNAPLPAGGRLDARTSPGFWVIEDDAVYSADQETDDLLELYVVPVEGGEPPRKLAAGPIDAWFPSVSPYGPVNFGSVLMIRDRRLESIGIEPGAKPIVLDGLEPNASTVDVEAFDLAPTGDRVVYRAREEGDQVPELYSVATGGRLEKAQLHPDLVAGERISSQRMTPDGARIVFQAVLDLDEPLRLYSVPTAGGSPILLSGSVWMGYGFELTPDGAKVLFWDPPTRELFVAPVDGSTPPVRLASFSGTIAAPKVSADGSRAAFLESGRLHAVPLDGSAPAVPVDGTGHHPQVDFQFVPDGSRLVYRSAPGGRGEIYVVTSDASSAPVRISDAMPVFGDVQSFALAPDGTRVVYLADLAANNRMELFSVPLAGGVAAARLHPALDGDRDVLDFRIAADSQRVVFRGDLAVDQRMELFSAPLDASRATARINGPLVTGGDVIEFQISPDGRRVLYLANQEASDVVALYGAPIRGGRGTIRLSQALVPGGDVHAFRISADSSTVAFTAARDALDSLTLLVAPTSGLGKASDVAGPFPSGGAVLDFALSADGSVVAFRADKDTPEVFELYAADIDRSAPAVSKR